MTILFKYAKKFAEKKGTDFIGVGVLGMPNVGKSALINMLKNKAVCATNSIPFTTRGIQEVKLNSHIHMIDCPSIMLQKQDGGTTVQAIRSAV